MSSRSARSPAPAATHPPLIDPDTFADAQHIVEQRSGHRNQRRANGSDYTLTGLMRCPTCGTAMLGIRAHGRSKTYRYYTCHNRNRYDATTCSGYRLGADDAEAAILTVLAGFYRRHHGLIAQAVTEAQRRHTAGHSAQQAELDAVDSKITDIDSRIGRYLTAFEHGKLDEDTIGTRLKELRVTREQLTRRRDELAVELDAAPSAPDTSWYTGIADHINAVIQTGNHPRPQITDRSPRRRNQDHRPGHPLPN